MSFKYGIPSFMASRAVRDAASPNGFYRTLTLDQPASDLTDFPVLFSGTYTYLKTIANGGKVNNSNGYDIVFYSDAALTTKLKFERVYWSASTGDVEFWVKIPSLTSASPVVIYLAYGNTTISTDQQDAVNTWNTNFKAVWHLADGSTLSLLDSTINNNDGTNNGFSATTGKIDGGASGDGSADYADMGSSATIQLNSFTFSAWVNPDAGATYKDIFAWAASDGVHSGVPQLRINNLNPGKLEFVNQDIALIATSTGTVTNATFSHVALVFDQSGSGTWTFYINGSASGTGSGTVSWDYPNMSMWLGARGDGGPPASPIECFGGSLDEAHVNSDLLTADWIATEYSNQNDPANFYVVGSETPA